MNVTALKTLFHKQALASTNVFVKHLNEHRSAGDLHKAAFRLINSINTITQNVEVFYRVENEI